MKKTLALITFATLFTTAAALAAPAKLQVTLSIAPNTTLPGLSVPLNLHVTNGSGAFVLTTDGMAGIASATVHVLTRLAAS